MLFKIEGSAEVQFVGMVEADSVEEAEELADDEMNYLDFKLVPDEGVEIGDVYSCVTQD